MATLDQENRLLAEDRDFDERVRINTQSPTENEENE
jgi:hypothetical protein